MHLLAIAALLDGGTGKSIDERQIGLVGDEHGRGAIIKAPLAQLGHRHVGNVDLFDRLHQFGLLDTGDAQHLPDTRFAVGLVDRSVFLDESLPVLRRGIGHVGPYRNEVHTFIDEDLIGRDKLTTSVPRAIGVLHVKKGSL